VDIPSGVNNRDVIRVVSQGHEHNNQKGNLFLNISVSPHDFFKRDEYDIYCEVPISYTDLVFGTDLKLNIFGDKIKVKIPSSTTNNTIFRIKNKGFNHINSRGSGDLYVKVVSEIPSKISGEYKKKLKELKDLEEKNITKEINKKYKDYIEL
ncbi:MAG: J domain-containing protein, partial [Candidatus ainarchaeum sp.]|nr:J domain-containing protein [Candidatus ainarchaeum sp.]